MQQFLFTVLFSFTSLVAFSTKALTHYSYKSGLPSTEIYGSILDEDGYLWFYTDNGLAKFDGKHFKKYTTNDGLCDNTFIEALRDTVHGGIIFWRGNGCFNRYHKGSFSKIQIPKRVNQHIKAGHQLIAFTEDKKGNYYFGFDQRDTCVYKDVLLGWNPLTHKVWSVDSLVNFYKRGAVFKVIDEQIILARQGFSSSHKTYQTLTIHTNSSYTHPIQSPYTRIEYTYVGDSLFIISVGDQIYLIESGQIIDSLKTEKEINNLFLDKNNSLWISFLAGGLTTIKYDSTNKKFIAHSLKRFHEFTNLTVSSLTIDPSGGYWFSTVTNGVFHLPNIQLESIQIDESHHGIVEAVCVDDTLFILTKSNTIQKIHDEKITTVLSEKDFGKSRKIIGLTSFDAKTIAVFFQNENAYRVGKNKIYPLDKQIGRFTNGKWHKDNLYFWTVSNRNLNSFKNGEYHYHYYHNLKFSFTKSILPIDGHAAYIGSVEGFGRFDKGTYDDISVRFPELEDYITGIEYFRDGILISTRNKGLFYYRDGISPIRLIENAQTNTINDISIIDSNNLLLGTYNGLFKLELNTKTFTIKSYKPWGITGVVNQIVKGKNKIWIIKNFEVSSYNPSEYIKPKAYIKPAIETMIHGLDTIILSNSSPSIKYSNTVIQLMLAGICFSDPGNVKYHYRLKGHNKEWQITANPIIQYAQLSPGDYSIELYATESSNIPSEIVTQNFTILPLWYQSKFVWGIIILSLIFLTIVIIRRYIQNKLAYDRLIHNLNTYKHQALSAQLNPHFIYNSLNSINYFVLNNNPMEASKYLSKFSDLMRSTLDHSQKERISLAEELKAIETYLTLEKIRFTEKFNFEIIRPRGLESYDIKVPPMLLQPYLENAIKHGLTPKKDRGELKVIIKDIAEYLVIDIIDDGIGRKAASKSKARNNSKHESAGMSITQKRIEISNALYGDKISIQVIDYTSPKTGTCVRIQLLKS